MGNQGFTDCWLRPEAALQTDPWEVSAKFGNLKALGLAAW
jgi:hypothetical protein